MFSNRQSKTTCYYATLAIELYALACENPYAGKSHWVADVVGKRIDEAARIRGQEMDMWETAVSLLAELSEQD